MTYQCIGENWGRSMIVDAIKDGYTVTVFLEGDTLYEGTSPVGAWEHVTSLDECRVYIAKEGARTEAAFIVLDYGQQGDEVINDFTVGGWIAAWWDAKFAKEEARS